MVGKNPGSSLPAVTWSWAALFVVVVAAPGIVYATLEGKRRTSALLWVIAVEAVLVVALGLYLRWRGRR